MSTKRYAFVYVVRYLGQTAEWTKAQIQTAGRARAAFRSRAAGWCLEKEQSRPREGPARGRRVATSVAVGVAVRICTEQRGGTGAELGGFGSPPGSREPQGCEAGTGVLRFALVTVSLTDYRAADRCWWAEGGPGDPF